jgi:hypothetical protein
MKYTKYIVTVEIEYETDGDPLEALHHMMLLAKGERDQTGGDQMGGDQMGGYADHYHIVEQPRELKAIAKSRTSPSTEWTIKFESKRGASEEES